MSSRTKLILATRNPHKVGEIQAILGQGFLCVCMADYPGAPVAAESAGSFAGNATQKSVLLAQWLSTRAGACLGLREGPFVLADDSGLEVDALNGAPGVHSARFAALDNERGNSGDAENNAKLLRLLRGVPWERRTARFRCVLALTPVMEPAPSTASPVCELDEFEAATRLFEGRCEGRIGFEPRGAGGFGYDPLFIPEGYEATFAELGEEVKNGLSHRARALAALKAALQP